MSKVGEPISFEFQSADASTAAAITIKDANGTTRTLGSRERLLIDSVACTLAAAVTLAELFDDANAGGTVSAGELIAAFGANNGNFDGGCEGFSVSVGSTPKLIASGAGAVDLTGTGRIVVGKGTDVRPTWRESL